MFQGGQILIWIVISLVGSAAFGADLTLVAVGAFGERLTECRVESFRFADTAENTRRDYKEHFRGLVARDLPDGQYEADIGCQEAHIGTRVKVSARDRFEVVSENRRIMRSDHQVPHLVIRINGPRPREEAWWLTLRALYQKRTDIVEFRSDTGEAQVSDPDPGSYLVNVLSTGGYDCLSEIDLVESTRLWIFEPAACTFHVDASAHVVTDQDKRELKTTSWYRQMRKREMDIFRALEKAAEAGSDSNLRK